MPGGRGLPHSLEAWWVGEAREAVEPEERKDREGATCSSGEVQVSGRPTDGSVAERSKALA